MQADAPEIHPRHPKVREPYRNIAGKTEADWGDLEKGFSESHLVVENRFESHLRTHGYLEPQAAVASFEPDGKLNIWTSSQGPFLKRAKLSRTLGVPQSAVRIHKAYVGGAFGGKIDLFAHEYCAALLSMKSGRPVRIVASRPEIFAAYRHGQPLIVEVKTGVKKDGTIVAQKLRVINNCGAYRGSGVVVVFLAWGFAMLPYRVPNLGYEGYAVYTNNPIRAPQRGHGAPQLRFAVESQLDMIAEELGLDPIEIRLRNARQAGEELPNGDNVHNCGLSDCIRKAAEHTGFTDKYGAGRGEGAASGRYRRGIGIGVSSYFGGSLIYPNSSSVMVPVNEIHLIAADTETTPVDIGSWISGNAYVTGNAARLAGAEVRRKLLEIASDEIEADIADLVLENKAAYVKGSPAVKVSYADLVAASIRTHRGDPITGEGHWRTMKDVPYHPSLATTKGRWSENYAFDAQVAEVEVDTDTGTIRLVRAVTAHDCGFPINPLLVEGQIDGQVSMALGHAFMEEVMMSEGRTLNPNWLEYHMPCIHNVAQSEHIDVVTEGFDIDRPYRTKEVGEGYVSAILAAIANAIYDAVGVRLFSTPFTPEKILRALGKIT
ncbi:MAG: molybdopterin-dependent oxidoreductase [Deltaproteobacteria bacterium]